MKIKWMIYSIAVILLAVSCKSKKNISKQSTIIKTPVEQVVEQIQAQEPKFETANVSKMNLALQINSRSFNVAASCKMIADSMMHISIMPMFGIEMFKVEITKDKIYVFDKLNKKYYETDFKFLERKIGIKLNYNNLESLISNQFFVVGQEITPVSKLKLEISKGIQTINYTGGNVTESVSINSLFGIENVNIYSVNTKYNLTTTYSDFALFDKINFPRKISIQASNSNNSLDCDFKINKVTFNTPMDLRSMDKSRFVKADINQLMKK